MLDTSDHFKNSFIMLLDPQNMGLDTLIVELCPLLAKKYTFPSNGVTNLHKNGTWDILSTF